MRCFACLKPQGLGADLPANPLAAHCGVVWIRQARGSQGRHCVLPSMCQASLATVRVQACLREVTSIVGDGLLATATIAGSVRH